MAVAPPPPLKSALFVDFDNVYSGLRKLDQKIADHFARQPFEWMNWLIHSLSLPDHSPSNDRRRVLVRRCYLNPQAYQRFRPSFNLAGFEIVDCPSLTSEGKTSTDIHMVLDIIDLLQHETRYDEFIVFSADADFTPVLRKLRRWDRRTTVLAIGFPSAAYRASADLLIDQDEFVRNALGFRDDDEAPTSEQGVVVSDEPEAGTLAATAQKFVEQAVAASSEPVPMALLAAQILKTVKGIDASTWAGHGSFRELVDSWDSDFLRITTESGGAIYDSRNHVPPTATAKQNAAASKLDTAEVASFIREETAKSNVPLACARLASLLITKFGMLAADWNGKGSFRRFMESLNLTPLVLDWRSGGGVIMTPGMQISGTGNSGSHGASQWAEDQHLLPAASQIHEVSSVPLLSPRTYRTIFQVIENDVRTYPFDLKETGKRARDRLREQGVEGSRSDVNWILRGLLMRGHVFGRDEDSATTLAMKTANNVRSLCLREQMVLDASMEATIVHWFGTDPAAHIRQ